MITKEMIEVMKAYVEGKKIEYASKNTPNFWRDTQCPVWNWAKTLYRVKHVPLEVYLRIYDTPDCSSFPNKHIIGHVVNNNRDDFPDGIGRIAKFREVMEDE